MSRFYNFLAILWLGKSKSQQCERGRNNWWNLVHRTNSTQVAVAMKDLPMYFQVWNCQLYYTIRINCKLQTFLFVALVMFTCTLIQSPTLSQRNPCGQSLLHIIENSKMLHPRLNAWSWVICMKYCRLQLLSNISNIHHQNFRILQGNNGCLDPFDWYIFFVQNEILQLERRNNAIKITLKCKRVSKSERLDPESLGITLQTSWTAQLNYDDSPWNEPVFREKRKLM